MPPMPPIPDFLVVVFVLIFITLCLVASPLIHYSNPDEKMSKIIFLIGLAVVLLILWFVYVDIYNSCGTVGVLIVVILILWFFIPIANA